MTSLPTRPAALTPDARRRLLRDLLQRQVDQARRFPVSFGQRRLWLLDQLEPGNPAYNIPLAVRLSGTLRLDILQRTLQELVRRHETLRTRFVVAEDGEPVQVVENARAEMLEVVEVTEQEPDAREAAALRRAHEEATKPFRLQDGPLFRALLVRLGPAEHLLMFVMHHIVSDGWSMGVLMREVAALYQAFSAGRPSPLPPLTIQYGDYAAWQRQRLSGVMLDRSLEYWRKRLEGTPTLELPTDYVRPARRRHRGARETVLWPESPVAAARRLGREEQATLFMTLLAAFQVLLARYSGQSDFAVGTVMAGRLRRDTEGLIGLFANTLAIRSPLADEMTFREVLRHVRQAALEAMEYQELPFEKLVEELNPARDMSRHPLFQVAFAFQNDPRTSLDLPELTLTPAKLSSQTAKWDLWLSVREVDHGLRVTLEYDVELFERETVQRMLEHLQVLLEAATVDPDQPVASLPLIREQERTKLLVEWNDTGRDFHCDQCLHQLVEAQVQRTPDGTAIVFEDQPLTYREFNARANQLAYELRRLDVGPDVTVGVCLERSPEMVLSLLAILKAGGAYLPLDPDYPADRLGFMLADAQPAVVLTTSALAGRMPTMDRPILCLDQVNRDQHGRENPPLRNGLDDIAYVIYTSGSTGKPKGVRNSHRGIVNRLLWMQQDYPLTPADRVLQKTPFTFDVSVWEFFWPLLTGAGLVVARPHGHKDPRYLAELIVRQRITTTHFVPSMLHVFLEDPKAAECRGLRRVICSGEALPYDLQQRCFAMLGAELHNLYGPTEAAVEVTHWVCRANDRGLVPIGKPIANMQCYILDRRLQPQPIGVPGELHLGGVGLARDYLNRPELTSERFIAHPFSSEPGARLYKTGDLCRYLPDGNIQFLGRLDHQVKIRGNRIELGEIQATLLNHPAIGEAVVTALKDDSGSLELAAYLVPKEALPPVAELRAFLQQTLPEYMVPSVFVPLATMPLNANGKVDYRALPRPERTRDEQREYVAPRTEDESQLAELWCEVLRIDRVGIHDNFFALGGHSLLATQVVSRIARRLQVDLPLRELFQAPTIAGLAEKIGVARALGRTGSRPPIIPVPRDQELPLSLTQEALWFLDRLEPSQATYTSHPTMRIRGPLDLDALQRALDEMIRRHETLRTTFPEQEGRPVQVIAPPQSWPLATVDLTGLPEPQREVELRRWLQEELRRPIALQAGPLVRITVLRLAADQHVAVVATHHIIYDGWSLSVLAREMSTLYRAYRKGEPSPLPALPIQYADFAVWQRKLLQGETLERLRDYWGQQLAGVPPLDITTDYPRPAIRSTRGDTRPCHLSLELSGAVKEFCQAVAVTPFMTLLAAFQLLLGRYSGQEDIAVGSPVANRTQPETEPLIGYFINMLALRTRLSGELSFHDLVRQVRQTVLDGFEHQDLTLDQVVEVVNPPRDTSRHPLFQVMFVLQNNLRPSADHEELQFEVLRDRPPRHAAYFELNLAFAERDGAFRGTLSFNTDLFAPETIERMIGHYQMLLADALSEPDQPLSHLRLLKDAERQTILVDWNARSAAAPPDGTVVERFEAQAAARPSAVAVVDGTRSWTYGVLNERANQIAHRLRAVGVAANQIVAVRLPRSAEMISAVLGVLKAGGAYLPLDVELPAERLRYTLQDAQAVALVTQQGLLGDLSVKPMRVLCLDTDRAEVAAEPLGNPSPRLVSEDLAYMIYTSGSTGRPKGVPLDHRALLNYTEAAIREYRIRASDRILQFASFSYDAHVEELYPCLAQGATLVLRSADAIDSVAMFVRRCDESQVTVVTIPTGFWHEWSLALEAEELPVPASLRLLIIGGEQAQPDRVASWFDRAGTRIRLLNTYGPTETTVVATAAELRPDDSRSERVPIGRPLDNTRVYVLDAFQRPVPIGVRGELFIGGASVAQGYWRQAELTAQRFLRDPFAEAPEARMFQTGDQVRWRPDGQLEFLGRADDQVKIRGFRVEPGEIEEALREHPLLAEAAVLAKTRAPGDLQLVAYVTPRDGETPGTAKLRRFLRERLPEYMVPAAFVALPTMPLTSSGKVDRRALPEPDWSQTAPRGEYVAPQTETEQRLAAIWTEVLNVPRVSLQDNFFELGGNSLLAVRLTSRVRKAFSIELSLVTLFAAPTLAELAGRIVERQTVGPTADAVPLRQLTWDGPAPLTFAQKQYWKVVHMFPGAPIGNMHATLPISGPLDIGTMRDTLNALVRRHEALRTSFATDADGRPVQVVTPHLTLDVPVEDLGLLPPAEQEAHVRNCSRQQEGYVFDFSQVPLLRVRLLRRSDNDHVLLLTMHHILSDGWSLQVLVREVAELYDAFRAGRPAPLPELPLQYRDYAAWERQHLQGPVRESLLDYWRQRLDGVRNPDLPTDRPRQSASHHIQERHRFRIPDALNSRVTRLAEAASITPFIVFLAAFQVLLRAYCHCDDVAVAAPVANRRRPETHGLIGAFVNTVVVRSDLSGNLTFREVLARMQKTTYADLDHQELPLELLADALQPHRDQTRFPFVQVMFNYLQRTSTQRPHRRTELQIRPFTPDSEPVSTRLDLILTLVGGARGLRGSLRYDAELFERETIARLGERFVKLLQAVAANPDEQLSQLAVLDEIAEGAAETRANDPSPAVEIAELARQLAMAPGAPKAEGGRSLVLLRGGDSGAPLFCIPGLGGHVAPLLPLARGLPTERPVYGLQAQGLEPGETPPERLEDMADSYVQEIRAVQPSGPYLLAGWSLGGLIAWEVAQQLRRAGHEPLLLALLDTRLGRMAREKSDLDEVSIVRHVASLLGIPPEQLQDLTPEQAWGVLAGRAQEYAGLDIEEFRRLTAVCKAQLATAARYRPQPYAGSVVLFRPRGARRGTDAAWKRLGPQLREERVPGGHDSMLRPPAVADLAEQLGRCLATAAHRDGKETDG